jgi:hypothetical protein
MSDEKKSRAVELFRSGATYDEAAAAAGVSSRTLYRWAEADPEFAELVEDARDRADDAVEAVMYRNCIDPDPSHNTLRMFWLKNRRRPVYGDQSRLEVSGPNGGPVELLAAIDKVYGDGDSNPQSDDIP